ncbi:hypothetical protein D9M68_616720 [compost metagenome]
MPQNTKKAIAGLDTDFENLYARAVDARDRFWIEARASRRVISRGVAISRRGNSVDIYWLRITYQRHELGPQKKPFRSRISKGRGSFPRFSRVQMGRMEMWLEEMFNRYEDEFEVLRLLIKENRVLRRQLERYAVLLEKLER